MYNTARNKLKQRTKFFYIGNIYIIDIDSSNKEIFLVNIKIVFFKNLNTISVLCYPDEYGFIYVNSKTSLVVDSISLYLPLCEIKKEID